MSDGHHVHYLGLAAHLDLLGGDLVRLEHDDDWVPGGLEDTGDDPGVTRDLTPTAQHLRAGTLVGSVAGP